MARRQIEHRLNAPLASSMGRLFDAASAVIGARQVAEYEGEAAMELESLAGDQPADPLPFPIAEDGAGWLLDPLPLLVALGEGAARGVTREHLAAAFHESVATTTAEVVRRACHQENVDTVVLCGGVFQNARLLVTVGRLLRERSLTVLAPRMLPPNDGAISYGQAAVAAARMHLFEGD
jgi:hydrogenase maturation protein HypF